MLGLGGLLFLGGLLLVLTRRSPVLMLVGVELMLNAANLNFVAFNRLYPENLDGQTAALFIIVLAAAEAAVGLALILNVYRNSQTTDLEDLTGLGG